MTTHQNIAIWAWVIVALAIAVCVVGGFLSLLAQFMGWRNVAQVLIAVLIFRVLPVVLIAYTVWAFLA